MDRYDRLARRNYGLDSVHGGTGTLNVAVLAGGRAVVHVQSSMAWTTSMAAQEPSMSPCSLVAVQSFRSRVVLVLYQSLPISPSLVLQLSNRARA